jgi:two-component system CheB/CheR fusion protein
VVHKDLRRAVIFGRNDLVKDAPISRVDLLACRNTLMYMNGDTQRNVLGRLHFALAPHGMLFLGHAEMLLSHSDRFTPVNHDHRVFRKTEGSHGSLNQFEPANSSGPVVPPPPVVVTVSSATWCGGFGRRFRGREPRSDRYA